MKKSKIVILSLLICLIFSSSGNVLAFSNENKVRTIRNDITIQEYQKLIKLGFPDDDIKMLAPEEIKDILQHNFKFITCTANHFLVISFKDIKTPHKVREEISLPLSETELKEYNNDKKGFTNKKVKEIIAKNQDLNEYLTYVAETNNPVSKFVDAAQLTVKVDVYDSSTDGYIYKTFGCNFTWDSTPVFTLTDAIAVSYNGSWWTDTPYYGGYYRINASTPYIEYFDDSEMIACGNGVYTKFNIMNPYDTYATHEGRIYIKAGNIDSQVPYSIYTLYGAYGHTEYTLNNFSVGIDGSGMISISGGLGCEVIDVRPYISGLYTY